MVPSDSPRAGGLAAIRRRVPHPSLSPQGRTNLRLTLVATSLVLTLVALGGVVLHAGRSEQALADTTARTLRDYSGYAGRLMGSEMLRRFSEQRARILAPVLGADPAGPLPPLAAVIDRGERELADRGPDSARGYFRASLGARRIEGTGIVQGDLSRRLLDTLQLLARTPHPAPQPTIIVMDVGGQSVSAAYATVRHASGDHIVYGFTYSRALGIAYWARAVFRETPLLPASFAGQRWNYDTTRVQSGEVINGALISVRVTDRKGRLFWQSRGEPSPAVGIGEQAVISTAAGGLVVETRMLAGAEPTLVPAAFRSAQQWWIRALVALAIMVALIALLALGSERAVARARRAEAMQQLALGLRHELNNALSTVLLNAELMAEDRGLDADARERVDAISEQASRMRDVLRRLEKRERLDVIVPYLDEGYMVDLSPPPADAPTGDPRRQT